jgi:hypothetical protein
VEKHAGHTFQKGVTLPRKETLMKQMQQKHNVPASFSTDTSCTSRWRKDSVTVQAWPLNRWCRTISWIPFCSVPNIIWSTVTTPWWKYISSDPTNDKKCSPATGTARHMTST